MSDKHLNKPPLPKEVKVNDNTLNTALKLAALVALILAIVYLAQQ